MLTDKPLHVQVAEALGMSCEPCSSDGGCPEWALIPSTDWDCICLNSHVPRYDTDWSATGPLIEKYGICLWNEYKGAGDWKAGWGSSLAYEGMFFNEEESGPTPLLAVCNLILALHQAGKLPQTNQNPPQDTQ